ncbi:MAG: choice-of-anchor Q domain-containing protein, partial [Steroidobacteraceae bacterium]
VVFAGFAAFAAGAAQAATFTVNSTTDAVDANPGNGTCATSGAVCTLRAAIQEANALAGADTIDLPAGTYTLTRTGTGENLCATGDLDITDALTLSGAGARTTTVNANNIDRVFHLFAATTISGVTIRGGNPGASIDGGGIFVVSGATAQLTDLAVTSNSARDGAGIYNDGNQLTLTRVTVSGNTGSRDGAGLFHTNTTATLTNVTLSGNTASGNGGGIASSNTLDLINVTITANTAVAGGGIRRGGGTITLKNTVLASNTGGNCSSTVTSAGNNLDDANTCLLTGPGDIVNSNPLLGSLQNNGGPTDTHALGLLSPAIDNGTNTGCPATDQRSLARPFDGDGDAIAVCDIGAYESQVASSNIAGTVYEDLNGDAGLGDAVGAAGVAVRLYADVNDNGFIDVGDTFIVAGTTDASGRYELALDTTSTGNKYLVAVDSKTVPPSGGFNVGFTQADLWAEQTYGDNPSTPALDLGPRIGGRTPGTSDNFNPGSTAPASNAYQHLARVDVTGGNAVNVNFAFSFRPISHTADRDDDGTANRTAQGSLRQTIQNANAIAGAPTISVPAGTYTLALAGTAENAARTGDLDITDALTLSGAGARTTTVDANGTDRVFHALANLTISGLTVRGGNSGAADGGGFFAESSAVVQINDATVRNNTADNGGGVASKGTITLTRTTVSGNTANAAAGGMLADGGTATLTNVTLSGNTAVGSNAGGLWSKGAASTLLNVTVTANTAAGSGGGIRREGGTVNAKNTIIANNTAPSLPNCQ